MSFDPSTGMYTVNEWNETEGGGKLKLSRLSAVAVQRQLQILEDYSKNKIRAEDQFIVRNLRIQNLAFWIWYHKNNR